MNPIGLLTVNASAQLLFSSLFGFYMLLPRQPWLKSLFKPKAKRVDGKAMLAAHLDWIMLAFMQLGAAFAMWRYSLGSLLVAWLLVLGGWLNPLPYLCRGFGIDAFVLAGPPKQKAAAALAGASSVGITVAWLVLVIQLVKSGALHR